MDRRQVAARVLILGLLQEIALGANPPDVPKEGAGRSNAAAVARLPYPGTVVPGAIGFTPDGKAVTYLKSEASSLSRVLWRAELTGDAPRVIARPPGEGDTEANVSQAEALRRERQRLRETGITQVVRAEKAEAIVTPLGGDLYLLRGEGPLRRITETPSPEIDPKLSRDGTKVAFVRDDELHVIDLETEEEVQLSHGCRRGADPRPRRVHRPGGDGSLLRLLVVARRGDGSPIRRPTSGTSPSTRSSIRGARDLGRDAPLSLRRARPMPGSASASSMSDGGATRWLTLADPEARTSIWRASTGTPRRRCWSSSWPATRSRCGCSGSTSSRARRPSCSRRSPRPGSTCMTTCAWSRRRAKCSGRPSGPGFRHLELRDRDGKLIRVLTSGDWPVDGVVALDQKRREAWFTAGRETPLEATSTGSRSTAANRSASRTSPGRIARSSRPMASTTSTSPRPGPVRRSPRSATASGKTIATIDDAATTRGSPSLTARPTVLDEFKNRDGVTPARGLLSRRGRWPRARRPRWSSWSTAGRTSRP